MKTKCYSVRLKSITQISNKCLKATDWQGKSVLVPISQYYGVDYEVHKSDAYWISAWLIEKDNFNLSISRKKEAWFDTDTKEMKPTYIVTKHKPKKIEPIKIEVNAELTRRPNRSN